MPEDAHVKTPGDREGIIRLATEYMGWKVHDEDAHGMIRMEGPDRSRYHYSATGEGWNPFTEIADAYELESAIPEAKRGAYVKALLAAQGHGSVISIGAQNPALFGLLHATPRQRSQAALEIIKESK